jgi:prepilin-type N-terminal cleavage/methylation domain-containing protein
MQKRGQNDLSRRRACRPAFTLVELLVVIAIIGILIALLLPAIQTAREAGRRAQCASLMHQVAIALLNYEATNRIFPPGAVVDPSELLTTGPPGRACTLKYRPNWIIMILPQLDQRPIFNMFAFNSPDPIVKANCRYGVVNSGYYVSDNDDPSVGSGIWNASARRSEIPSLLCASDNKNNYIHFQGAVPGEAVDWARGNVGCNAGQFYYSDGNQGNNGTTGTTEKAYWGNPLYRGIMATNDHEISLAGITDGTQHTILIAELRSGIAPSDRRGTWAMGGGNASMMVAAGGIGDDNGPNYCTQGGDDIWGGSTFQSGGATAAQYSECTGICQTCFNLQTTTRSLHTGGVNLAMADASVHFVLNTIETSGPNGGISAVWDWLITSSDSRRIDAKKTGF